jgi:hypothetical protein
MSHRILRVLYLLVPLGLIAAFVLRPTPLLGVDGESLAASTGAPVNEINAVPCEEKGEDKWTCTIPGEPELDPEDPSPVSTTYEVTIDSWGCWTIGGIRGPTDPPESTGCVTIMNHVESID